MFKMQRLEVSCAVRHIHIYIYIYIYIYVFRQLRVKWCSVIMHSLVIIKVNVIVCSINRIVLKAMSRVFLLLSFTGV
jgi:hypothetical protein